MDAELILTGFRGEPDPERRSEIVRRIALDSGHRKDDGVTDLLVEALADEDPVVQEWASVALRRFRDDPRAIRALWDRYVHEERESIRCYTLVALAKVGQHLSAGALRDLYRERRERVDDLLLNFAVRWTGRTAADANALQALCDIVHAEARRTPVDHRFLTVAQAAALRCAKLCLIAGTADRSWLREHEQDELLKKLGEDRIKRQIEEERARRSQSVLPTIDVGDPDRPLVPGLALSDDHDDQYIEDLGAWKSARIVESRSYLRDLHLAREAKRKAGYACEICGDHLADARQSRRFVHAHHIEPLAAGGADEISNLIVVCPGCHGRIHAGEIRVCVTEQGRTVTQQSNQAKSLAKAHGQSSAESVGFNAALRAIVELLELVPPEQLLELRAVIGKQLGESARCAT